MRSWPPTSSPCVAAAAADIGIADQPQRLIGSPARTVKISNKGCKPPGQPEEFHLQPPQGTVKLRTLWVGEAGAVGYPTRMTTPRDPLYAGYRYPAELISYAVWLYFRFPLSLRMVEEMLAARGISVTYG